MLIVTEFLTLDGVAQGPGRHDEDRDGGFEHGGWQAPLMEEGTGPDLFARAEPMDALLLGRKTYEIFADYWPTAPEEIPYTGLLNRVPKYVASTTLSAPLEWQGSTLLQGEFVESINELKASHAEVHVIGSLDLVQSLLQHRLVDRLHLWLYPLALGTGKQLFAGGTVPTTFRLTESKAYPGGTVHLAYDLDGVPTYGDMTID